MAYSDASEKSRLYVGNLSFQTTEAELDDWFGKYGRLTECNIVLDRDSGRSRGFGFVTFQDPDAAQTAIDALNDADCGGRRLSVSIARARSQGGRGGGGGGRGGGRGGYDGGYNRGYGGGDRY